MKIVQVHPGILPIPPNGWGAVEKIIWEYKCNLEKTGHLCDVLYLDDIDPLKYDIVHVHMANLALMLHEKNIPYFFTCHDHHAYIYGKESSVYKQNYLAMKYSIKSFVPAKYLVGYFDLPNVCYLSHGVNTDFFESQRQSPSEHKILCVANNSIGHSTAHDRKGFGFAIKAAKNLGLPITVAGPDNNKNFFDSFDFKYDKLTIRYNLTEDELLEAYQSHSIFVHASDLEAGHPNLTLLEAMSCGLPVVGTLEDNNSLDGMIKVKRDVEEITQALTTIMNDYDNFREKALGTASKKRWVDIVKQLAPIYAGESMGGSLIRIYKSTSINHINAKKASNRVEITEDKGCKVEILGPAEETYRVKFLNKKDNKLLHEVDITNNMWCSTGLTEGLEWKIILTENSTGKVTEYSSAPKDETVSIVNESGSLGDAIAWIPVVNEFAIQKNKKVNLYTPFKDLFQKEYPSISFYDYSSKPRELTKKDYVLACSESFDWKSLNLQEIASKILGLPHKEVLPKITLPEEKETRFKKKYVCIATQSTSQCKYWNNEDGWVKIVDYLKSMGYDVVCIDKHSLFGAPGAMNEIPYNCIDDSGEKPLNDRIKTILGCEFFIGLSSGLSWLAWACKKKCIMISGFTDAFHEFQSKYRVINKNVCNSCWHDSSLKFDASNWLWCPRKKNFECSKEISYEMVKEKIDICIKDLSLER
jgi:autotransporter strand-loop-strand O-heptosyltransferase